MIAHSGGHLKHFAQCTWPAARENSSTPRAPQTGGHHGPDQKQVAVMVIGPLAPRSVSVRHARPMATH